MQKTNRILITDILLFLTVWVYYSLNAKYINFAGFTILRWVLPFAMIGVSILENDWHFPAPPRLFWWFTVAVMPSIFLGSDITTALIKYLSLVLVFYGSFIFFAQLRSTEKLNRCLMTVVVVLVIYQLLNTVFVLLGVGEIHGRSTGITTNANTLGIYSNLAFWAGFYLFKRAENDTHRALAVVFLLTVVYTVLACGSRTAFVVLILNITVAVYMLFGQGKPIWLLGAGLLLAGGLVLSGKLDFLNIAAIDRLSEEGGTTREELWEHGISVWKQHIAVGVGYTLSQRFNMLTPNLVFHNSYLSYLIECGIWGAVILGIGFINTIVRIISSFVKEKLMMANLEVITACMMIVGLAVAAWSESFLFAVGSTEGYTFWFLLAWLLVYIWQRKEEQHPLQR